MCTSLISSIQWLEARGNNATCPVCKAAIDKERLVPIYGRGNEGQEDPRYVCVPPIIGERHINRIVDCIVYVVIN